MKRTIISIVICCISFSHLFAQTLPDPVPGTFTDARDGKVYKTVKIGDQVWMAENLAYLPTVNPTDAESYTDPYYYVYGYSGTDVNAAKATTNYSTYGVLYNWPAALMACPVGWHLPSDAEWATLENYLIANGYNFDGTSTGNKIGKSLATATGWASSTNLGAVGNTDYPDYQNLSGFSGLPGGRRDYEGTYTDIGSIGTWWSSTENFSPYAWLRSLYYFDSDFYRGYNSTFIGYSVRCVRNAVSVPNVSTSAPDSITQSSVILGGEVTSDGGSAVTDRGVCFSTMPTPTISNNMVPMSNGMGAFKGRVTGLTANTTYFSRAYAVNGQGVAYGDQVSFATQASVNLTGTFADSRDGKVYKTVKIGDQVWMAENLAYLPSVSSPTGGSDIDPYYYVYDYSGTDVNAAKATTNYSTYGVLYNWPAALTACPPGWHMPSDVEWKQVEMALGMTQAQADAEGDRGTDQGTQMKTTSGWNYLGNGTNSSGFSGLPGGYRYRNGTFDTFGSYGYWWSSTESSEVDAWSRILYYSTSGVLRYYGVSKDYGFSARCVRDESNVNDTLSINLKNGWNIFSSNVTPDSTDLKSLFKTLIDNEQLVKIQDESGNAIEDVGDLGNWTNQIGEIALTEGYKIRLTDSVNFQFLGQPAEFPFEIPLKAGWNIMGYPLPVEANALQVVKQLIDQENLVKVQDESGNMIEDIGVYGGWTNFIGTFKPGEGYRIKVTREDTLTISAEPNAYWQPGEVWLDSRDSNDYKTVQIGEQTWLAENLAYLPTVSPSTVGSSDKSLYYVYGYEGTDVQSAKSTEEYRKYGALYNWTAAMDSAASSNLNPSGVMGVCPDGWHLPSDVEWKQMEKALGMTQEQVDSSSWRGTDQASQLKSIYSWSDGGNGTNSSGFTALPGGERMATGGFCCSNPLYTYFISSTEESESHIWQRGLYDYYTDVSRSTDWKERGYSVRCVKDSNYETTILKDTTDSEGLCYFNLDTLDINIKFQALDTLSQPIENVDVRCHKLSNHVIFYVNEIQKTPWFRIYTYDELLGSASQDRLKSTEQVQFAVTAIIATGLALYSIGSFIYEMVTDPPHIDEIETDDGLTKKCIVGDWNDVIETAGLIGAAGSVFKAVKVIGAPATIRGVTAINIGLTYKELTEEGVTQLVETLASLLGPLDKERTVICWYKKKDGDPKDVVPIIYVDDKSVTTGTFTDSRDGNVYDLVEIGDQTWMAENLAYLPSVSPPTVESYTDPFYFVYDYSGTDVDAAKATGNYSTYGVLYNWPAALSACPTGWHLPSDAEWTTLTTFFGGESVAGGKMKETGIAHWASPNTGATNESRFSGLPGGFRRYNGYFDSFGILGYWWSSTEYSTASTWFRNLYYENTSVGRDGYYGFKEDGFSVRCVRDN